VSVRLRLPGVEFILEPRAHNFPPRRLVAHALVPATAVAPRVLLCPGFATECFGHSVGANVFLFPILFIT
jgi:hypothetical protein